jgi:Siphovirus Gp157
MTASTLKLYEATDAIEIVRDWILEHDEELRANEGALPDELAELLAKVEGDFAQKAERVALFIREMIATGKAIKIEEERLYARRKSLENASDRLKRYLEMNMLVAEKMRIDGKLVTLRIQKNPASLHRDRELSQDELAALHKEDSTLVIFTPSHFDLNGSAVIAASRKTDAKGNVIGYECPIAGLRVHQGASLRIV